MKGAVVTGFMDISNQIKEALTSDGRFTADTLQEALAAALTRITGGSLASAVASTEEAVVPFHSPQPHSQMYVWASAKSGPKTKGKKSRTQATFRRLPLDYKLPHASTLRMGFELWYCGNAAKGIPPLRSVQGSDFSLRTQQKFFSDWFCLFTALEEHLMAEFTTPSTPLEVITCYEKALVVLRDVLPTRKRKQRDGQLALRTVVGHVRKHLKTQQKALNKN